VTQRFIPPHGGYEKLLPFRSPESSTMAPCGSVSHYMDKRDRTYIRCLLDQHFVNLRGFCRRGRPPRAHDACRLTTRQTEPKRVLTSHENENQTRSVWTRSRSRSSELPEIGFSDKRKSAGEILTRQPFLTLSHSAGYAAIRGCSRTFIAYRGHRGCCSCRLRVVR